MIEKIILVVVQVARLCPMLQRAPPNPLQTPHAQIWRKSIKKYWTPSLEA